MYVCAICGNWWWFQLQWLNGLAILMYDVMVLSQGNYGIHVFMSVIITYSACDRVHIAITYIYIHFKRHDHISIEYLPIAKARYLAKY